LYSLSPYIHLCFNHRAPVPSLPAVRDLTRDGEWSTYDVSVLKKMGGDAHRQDTLYSYHHHQQNSPGWVIFLQLARRGNLPAGCSMYMSFLWFQQSAGATPLWSLWSQPSCPSRAIPFSPTRYRGLSTARQMSGCHQGSPHTLGNEKLRLGVQL
jgi:hypothetical protein